MAIRNLRDDGGALIALMYDDDYIEEPHGE